MSKVRFKSKSKNKSNPRILIVTPEVTYLPSGMGNIANYLSVKAGGLADVSASLISTLFEHGADVHVALPDYRALFGGHLGSMISKEHTTLISRMPHNRIHLAEDRAFYYMNEVYSAYGWENIRISLAFQREVINNIIPMVKPDLIHCNDWMTGLVPGYARFLEIPCLFTVHNIHTVHCMLSEIEDRGVDAALFWEHLYFKKMAYNYEEARSHNPVDFLTSGIFSAHFVNTVSPRFLEEVVRGMHDFIQPAVESELTNKWNAGCASGILNAPDPMFSPVLKKDNFISYSPETHVTGKEKNKLFLQKILGLIEDRNAPLFFWPSRLDPVQKGCQLLSDILYSVLSKYWNENFQVVFVANGEYQIHFKNIVDFHKFNKRVAVCDFDEKLAHLAYGASDFILMPSRFEPCGLPQMIGALYGALPVANDTGGIHDTISCLDEEKSTGNGFLFNIFDSSGLFGAIDQAMDFFKLSGNRKKKQIQRIMEESAINFSHDKTARKYISLYEKMLNRPLIS